MDKRNRIGSILSLYKSQIFPSIWLELILIIVSTSNLISAANSKPPDIWLNGYVKEDSFQITAAEVNFLFQNNYKNDFVSKNGTDFVIAAETEIAIFTCEASYPVTWKFPFPKQLESLTESGLMATDYRMSDFNDFYPSPLNSRYKIVIAIAFHHIEFLSINVTCASLEAQPEIHSSIYIYLADKSSLEHEGETLQVYEEPPKYYNSQRMAHPPPLALPCRPSSPAVHVGLEYEYISFVEFNNGTIHMTKTWSRAYTDNNIKFDPKIGFIIAKGVFGNHGFGLYRCSVLYINDDGTEELDTDQFVLVNVTEANNSNKSSPSDISYFESKTILHGTASVNVQNYFSNTSFVPRPQVVCCTGIKDKPPTMYAGYCNNALDCELKKNIILNDVVKAHSRFKAFTDGPANDKVTGCSRCPLSGITTVVICDGQNMDYVEEFIQTFHPEIIGPIDNRSERIRAMYTEKEQKESTLSSSDRVTSLSQFVSASATGNGTAKMTVMIGQVIPYSHQLSANFPIEFVEVTDKLLEAVGAGYTSAYSVTGTPTSFSEDVYLKEYDRDIYYEGERLTFMCFGSRLFYANGARLRLNWKDLRKTVLEPRNFFGRKEKRYLYLSGNAMMFENWGEDLVNIFGIEIAASREMRSVDCWMPSRNGSRWDKISKSIQVVPSVAPRFLEKEEEIVNFYLGDTGKLLTCTEADGVPYPKFTVTRDGKLQEVMVEGWTENVTESWPRHGWKNGTREIGTWNETRHLMKLNIAFDVITHDDQGVWKCIVENVKGTRTRTIKVFVNARPGTTMPISLSVAAVVSLIAIVLGMKLCHDKRKMNSVRATYQ